MKVISVAIKMLFSGVFLFAFAILTITMTGMIYGAISETVETYQKQSQ